MDLVQVLKSAVEQGCSDVHIVVGKPPMMRKNGEIRPIDPAFPALSSEDTKELIYSILYEDQQARFEENLELDCSHDIPGLTRLRVNALMTRNGVESAMRVISSKIPPPEALGITQPMLDLAALPRGMVLVTGPTGSGKSTTLACLVERANETRAQHVLTIEDPIEFVYEPKKSIIRQREIGHDTKSFPNALRAALREDPDIILVGEMRDYETIGLAVTAAETGHLCFGTLHTQDAPSTVARIIDVFPASQQTQIRVQVANSLRAVIAQLLLPRRDGKGRVAARELMIVTPAIANQIREGKPHLIYSAIETGAQFGMVTMDRSLADLVKGGLVDPDVALAKAHNPDQVRALAGLRAAY
ncbi:MAG TPA: type IV pilus twitching motility protein PilT [Candidatus Methylomirabilis sp.]|nr:type IV pilus twitching motility protein PilT [Candidatus Methylomirabilis sp.]